MADDADPKALLRWLLPRVARAALWAAVYTALLNYLPLGALPLQMVPGELRAGAEGFIYLLLFFSVARSLASGTILANAFDFSKGMATIAFSWYTLRGGLIEFSLPSGVVTATMTIDLRAYVAMLLLAELLGLAKNLIQAVDFLSKRVEAAATPD